MKHLFKLWMALVLAWNVASARPFTASDLVTLREIGTVAVSPNGRWVAWDQRETDLVSNDAHARLWLLDLEHPAQPQQLAVAGHHPRFAADGEWIYFLSDASGVDQLWRVPTGKGAAQQMSDLDVAITGYAPAPAGDEVAIWADVSTACNELPCDLPQPVANCCGNGEGFDSAYVQRDSAWRQQQTRSTIYVPHRNEWMMPEIRSRIFVMSTQGGTATSAMGRWLGDARQAAWSADGTTLFYTLREARREERFSLNLDVIQSRIGESAPTNLTAADPGVDALPAASPDGRWLAYVSEQTLRLRDLATGAETSMVESVRSIAWATDSQSVFVTRRVGLDEPLFQVSLDGHTQTRLTGEGRVANVIPLAQGDVIFTLDTMLQPADVYRISAEGQLTRLTTINDDRWRDIETARVERFEIKGAKGASMPAWKIAPDVGRGRLPTVLLIHDGAQADPANSWSRHWNPLLFASPGYAVMGVEFHSNGPRIERDRLALEDLKRALAGVDADNVCIVADGAYGGYLAYRIAGEWSRQPRCLVTNGGVIDATSISYQTDEPWMHDWQALSTSGRNSDGNPLQWVEAWRTPLLILHGEKNFRVPYTQSLVAFTAAQRRNVPSRLVVFPDEGVRLQSPKNTIQWYGEVFNWLGRWLSSQD